MYEVQSLQVPPLLIVCLILALYGFIQPYKSLFANVMEIVVLTNFILLLALESTSFFRDLFPSLGQMVQAGTSLRNGTDVDLCNDETDNGHGLTGFTIILLPFYYIPLFLFIVAASIKLILYIR